jgi:transglycosylase-like protein with SLT domain
MGTAPRTADGAGCDIWGVRRVQAEQRRLACTLLMCVLAVGNVQANAQAGAVPPKVRNEIVQPATQPPTIDNLCRTLEQAAAENALPTEFFARVIWQESRFNPRALSSKGARGIAQFMPQTAHWHGLRNPFNPIDALRHSAGYLRELRERFGNLGLAAAAYNAGPGRVSAWLIRHRLLPGETRSYVAMVTGWTADEWASPSPPQTADTTIPQGIPCTRLAKLMLAPNAEAKQLAVNAQEHIAVPIDTRMDPVRPTAEARASGDAESFAPGDEKSTASPSPEAPAPQPSTSAQLSSQMDGAAPARSTSWSGASPTVATVNLAVSIDARGDSVSADAESTAPSGEKSTALSISEPPGAYAAPWPDASPTVAVPRWGIWLAAHLTESKAWAIYRDRHKWLAPVIGSRSPVVLHRQLPGMGMAKRYIIAIADDSRAPLESFCTKLIAADCYLRGHASELRFDRQGAPLIERSYPILCARTHGA